MSASTKPPKVVDTPDHRERASRIADQLKQTLERNPQLELAWDFVTRPSSLSVLDQAVVSATNLATGIALGRLCDAESYGSYVLAITIAVVGTGILCELVTNPFTVYGQRRRGGSLARYFGSALIHQAIATVLVLLAITGAIAATGQLSKLPLIGPVALFAIPLIVSREFVRQISFARFRFATAISVDLFVSFFQISGLALLWSFDLLSARAALACFGIACGLVVSVWAFAALRTANFSHRHAVTHARRNWRFARWTLIAYLVGSTTPFIMPWVLAGFHGKVATGRLAAANALIGLSFTFVSGISNWLTATAAREYRVNGAHGLLGVLSRTMKVLAIVLVPFVVGVWFFGENVIHLVYGDDFIGLGMVSFVIALGVLANSVNVVAGNGLLAVDRPRDGLKADFATLLATIGLALAFVPYERELGAAIAIAGGQAIGAVLRSSILGVVLNERRQSPEAIAMPLAAEAAK